MKIRIIEKFPKNIEDTKFVYFLVQYRRWFMWRTYSYSSYNVNYPKGRESALQCAQESLAELKQKILSARLLSKVILTEDTNDSNK